MRNKEMERVELIVKLLNMVREAKGMKPLQVKEELRELIKYDCQAG